MTVQRLFPTLVYRGRLKHDGWQKFNNRLLRECLQLRADDAGGRRWSVHNYPGGYTSYNSASRMHQVSPTFAELERRLRRHMRSFVTSLQLDLMQRELAMTDCWVSIMPRRVVHGLHLHPLSTLSGTYYVKTPSGCPGLKFEDPRLDRFMASPPRGVSGDGSSRPWVVIPARAGELVLFESWLRHEVPPNTVDAERINQHQLQLRLAMSGPCLTNDRRSEGVPQRADCRDRFARIAGLT
jgi:uncharacterized protein (TIGR02466 family)